MFPNSGGTGYCEGGTGYLGTQHPVYVPSNRAVLSGLGTHHQYNHSGTVHFKSNLCVFTDEEKYFIKYGKEISVLNPTLALYI